MLRTLGEMFFMGVKYKRRKHIKSKEAKDANKKLL
jgi:hypothetical protein